MPGKVIPEETRAKIIVELASGRHTQLEIAEKFGVSKHTVTDFNRKYRREIDEERHKILPVVRQLWIKDQEWRLSEMEQDAAMLKGKRSPDYVRARVAIFKQAAEELGQVPGRTNIVVIPVQHVIEGVNVDDLS